MFLPVDPHRIFVFVFVLFIFLFICFPFLYLSLWHCVLLGVCKPSADAGRALLL